MLNTGNLLKSVLMFAVAGSCCIRLNALTAEEKEKAVKTAEKSNQSIVRVEGTVSLEINRGGGSVQKSEQEVNTFGSIVDSSGLVAVPYVYFNPEEMLRNRMPGIRIKASASQLKLTLEDGSVVEARLVLEDPLTGFAFLRPVNIEKGRTFTYVDFSSTAQPSVLDQIITLRPLGKSMKYENAVSLGVIAAKIEKPRLTYAVSGVEGYPSMPVYVPSGSPVGLLTLKDGSDTASGDAMLALITGDDINDLIKQALAAPMPEPAPSQAPEITSGE